MKNFIKKSIVALFTFAILFLGHSTFASALWNGASSDCITVAVANNTTQAGYGSPCWTLSSVNANPGDSINVLVSYHNTSSAPATNVRVVLNAPTGSSTTQTFTGQIVSDQGNLPFGPVTVNISSAQTLTFGSTRWFPNQTSTPAPFLSGQTGAEFLTNSGLYIGTINPSVSTKGAVGASFLVGSTVAPTCTISSFTANGSSNTSVTAGSPVTLSWNTTSGCSGVSISGLSSFTGTSGSTTVNPTSSTNYTLTAFGGSNPTQSVFVTVNAAPVCTISSFTPSSTSVTTGQPVTLTWNTNNCTTANISGVGSVATSGSTTVFPTSSTSYTLTATGTSGSVTQSTFVTVNAAVNCTISNFNANPTSITSGNPVTINWSTSNCTSATISGPGLNSNALSGSQVVYPTTSGTYTITAFGSNGPVTQSAFVTVNSTNNCTISSFNANSSTNLYVTSGSPVTIYWSTNNCTSAIVSGPNLSNNTLNGSQTIYPTTSGTYTITAYNSNGTSVNQTLYVGINSNNSYCSITGLNASSSSVSSGSPVTIYWSTSNCTSATISGPGLNSNALSGSQVVYPTTSGTYTLSAYGSNGSPSSQAITVSVNNLVNSNVVTTVATNVSRTTAQLNGLISNGSAGITTTYFEFGPTVSLGYQTAPLSTSGNSAFSDTVSNLSPGTIYYFRAVGGSSRGTIEFFETLGATTPTPVVIQGTTVTTNSPIKLKIEDRYESIGVGDIVDYTVTYKNIGKSKLTHPMLQVIAPKNIVLTNASSGTYSTDTNTLSIPLEDLAPGQEGIVYAQGKVASISSNTAQIVTTAILVYTNPSGAQENAMAYVLNKPKDGQNSLLGAAALFSGLGNLGLLGWLVLILVALLIVHAARGLTSRPKPVATASSPFNH